MKTATGIIFPTVHINGTGKQDLIDERCAVVEALYTAGKRLAAACPNGRDFYPDECKEWEAAYDQHKRRLQIIRDLTAEMEAETSAIADQG